MPNVELEENEFRALDTVISNLQSKSGDYFNAIYAKGFGMRSSPFR